MHNFKDLTGLSFSRLTVLSRAENSPSGKVRWNCLCLCGNTAIVSSRNLRTQHTASCGCLNVAATKKSNTTHGKNKTAEHKIWIGMKNRCSNPKNRSFARYGGKGIAVCERWTKSFEGFLSDMGHRPSPAHSIDRIKSSLGYSPWNCRWATIDEQQNNKNNSVKITSNGSTLTAAQWSRKLGGNAHLVLSRLGLGWTKDEAVSIPKGMRRREYYQKFPNLPPLSNTLFPVEE